MIVGLPRAGEVSMVGIAQLVEHRLVVPVVAGSSPVVHPKWERFKPSTRVTTLCPV